MVSLEVSKKYSLIIVLICFLTAMLTHAEYYYSVSEVGISMVTCATVVHAKRRIVSVSGAIYSVYLLAFTFIYI